MVENTRLGYIDWPEPDQVYGADEAQRHCSTCRTETTGAPLCDRCAWQMRRDCKLARLAIIARAGVGSGAIRNLRDDEALLKEYDEWKLEQEARAQQREDLDEFKTEQMRSLF